MAGSNRLPRDVSNSSLNPARSTFRRNSTNFVTPYMTSALVRIAPLGYGDGHAAAGLQGAQNGGKDYFVLLNVLQHVEGTNDFEFFDVRNLSRIQLKEFCCG